MTDFAAARHNMVESQVRPNGITDRRIVAAMADIAREDFVPPERRAVAYVDEDILLAAGPPPRWLIQAMVFARLVQLAEVGPGDRVLQVGAATGYGTAVLARLAAAVVAVESDAALLAEARANLGGLANVTLIAGNLADGASALAPFDAIIAEGSIAEMPRAILDQAAEGGRIVAVVGGSENAKAKVWTAAGSLRPCRTAFDAAIAPLPGFQGRNAAFIF
jgi:protein-L-isoaspartate(D-aspartate) O-methyltransferase